MSLGVGIMGKWPRAATSLMTWIRRDPSHAHEIDSGNVRVPLPNRQADTFVRPLPAAFRPVQPRIRSGASAPWLGPWLGTWLGPWLGRLHPVAGAPRWLPPA